MDVVILVLEILILLGIGCLFLFKDMLFSYSKTKGKNLATKEDISEITKLAEEIKEDIHNRQEIEAQKRQLKYDAIMSALKLIDAHLSHYLLSTGQKDISKQTVDIETARACHNSLILTCEDTEILYLFSRIIFGPSKVVPDNKMPTVLLNEFRNLVRKELEFGSVIKLDEERAWISYGNFEKQN
ncbi:MAG: hypothetical protein ACQEQV_08915 [Fibrobacterota bacterium]